MEFYERIISGARLHAIIVILDPGVSVKILA